MLWTALGLLVTGWDRGQGLAELALGALVLAVISGAARHEPNDRHLLLLAGGLALLSLWALWQETFGFHLAHEGLAALPENVRNAVRFRLDSGRAFASQLHPGHLGVLLATVVPLAGAGIAGRRHRRLWLFVLFLASLGLVLARSPLTMALAAAGLLATLPSGRGRGLRLVAAASSLILLAVVVFLRPDLLHLDPIVWRLENWHNALWVWSGSPITGVGLGGFGQAALSVPFPVPNHPLHAHNLPLEWLAEMGLPGLFLAIVLYYWIFSVALRLWRHHRGLAAAILIVPLHNLADFSLFQPGIAVVWATLVGWALAVAPATSESRSVAGRRWTAATAAALAAAFFGLSWAASAVLHRPSLHAQGASALHAEILAHELAPWQPLSPTLAQSALSATGAEATILARVIRHERWWRPHSATLARATSLLAARAGDLPTASADAWEAKAFTALDRRMANPPAGPAP
ncbi:MAG TPA: O-antigen ligase family protein [Acidobacteria bacterium]|nr:O-antigen ligase family protein [Acidobacteriota bacterium]